MELTDNPIQPNLGLKYSELVDSIQEYDQALNQYEDAIETYEATISQFQEGRASPVEMKEAMDQFVYADDQLMDAAIDLESSVMEVTFEFSTKGQENNVVTMATENTLAAHKMEETTDNFSNNDYDFIKSLEELEELDDKIDTTTDIMNRDGEFLSENLDYSWNEAMDKVSDHDTEQLNKMVEGFALSAKRKNIIEDSPNDRYLGGFASDSGTKDLDSKREEVLGSDSDLKEKRKEVLDTDEEKLEEARKRVQDREPRYIH